MVSTATQAVRAYSRVNVETGVTEANPHQLITLLFDGALSAIARARFHMRSNDARLKGAALTRAIEIIDGGLKASLDLSVGGDLARSLHELYAYMSRRLVLANLKNDERLLDEVAGLLKELGDAWRAIGRRG